MIDKSIAKAAIQTVGVGPRESEPDDQVFERACLHWINQWLSNALESDWNQEACIFLFNPERKPESLLDGAERQYCFASAFPSNLAGYAYACSTGMNSVFRKKIPIDSYDVPAVLQWISNGDDMEQCFVIVFSPRLRRIYTKQIGTKINSDEDVACIQLAHPTERVVFDFQKLDSVLTFFYDHGVKTHLGACRIWKDPKERTLVESPEDMVHRCLFLTLLTHIDFNGHGMTSIEVHNVNGRKDIQIVVNLDGQFLVGIIELKVLFPKKSDKWNLDWAMDGVDQVVDYRNATTLQKIECSYTCLYDGRKADAAMPDFFTKAKTHSVTGRRYFMTTDGVDRRFSSFTQ